VEDDKSSECGIGKKLYRERNGRQSQQNSSPDEEKRGADEISFTVNPRVSHEFMAHPTDAVGVILEIDTKASFVNKG
jgi:hypothetical protein